MKNQTNKPFSPISIEELLEILSITIKRDNLNKVITFLCQLSAYTEESQFNLIYNAPSSTGKSYIPLEVAKLFPEKDVMKIAYASPSSFLHDHGSYSDDIKGYEVDLKRKIIIFMDQPHSQLLKRLRPLLSHDEKEIIYKITDKKNKKLKTKKVIIKGFPSVIFCTSNSNIDEQEASRTIILSPETSQKKLKESLREKVKKEGNPQSYKNKIENNSSRKRLKQRIKAIRKEKINNIIIPEEERNRLFSFFENHYENLKPHHSRDIGRLARICQSHALLNIWYRRRKKSFIYATNADSKVAIDLWKEISKTQKIGVPPYLYRFHQEIILPAYKKNDKRGISREKIIKEYSKRKKGTLSNWKLRQEYIPKLKTAGLVREKSSSKDGRIKLIIPINK